MYYTAISLLILAMIYFPSFWVRMVMRKHASNLDNIPGTGAELAQHLINRLDLNGYIVEQTDMPDHFDPESCAIRLSRNNHSGKSLTAVAVAAHEVGHAIQHFRNGEIFQLRTKYIPIATSLQKLGVISLAIFPFLAVIIKSPIIMLLTIVFSLAFQILGALSYLIVLPEEWDASFNKALPILVEGNYISPNQIEATTQVLKAAAYTYFAAALANVVNIWQWLVILRR